MKKIIIRIVLLVFVIACLTVPAFANENYDSSHEETGCCLDTSGVNHYLEGYDDGYLDGQNDPSQEVIDSAISDYKHSTEYNDAIDSAYNSGLQNGYVSGNNDGQNNPSQEAIDSAIAEYKNSQEYKDAINDTYKNGILAGYNNASVELDARAEQMYQIGLQDGYVDYQQSEQYLNTLNEAHQQGYSNGYSEGHTDGFEDGTENSVKPSTLYSLLTMAFVLVILAVAFTLFIKKKGKTKK